MLLIEACIVDSFHVKYIKTFCLVYIPNLINIFTLYLIIFCNPFMENKKNNIK